MNSYVSKYLDQVKTLIDVVSESAVESFASVIESAWRDDRRVLIMGNGGSAATASHIVNDLQKCIQLEAGRPLKVLCLSDCTPLIMAWANDTTFDNVFAPQVACWAEPNDVVVAISGSGNSPNVLRAVEMATSREALTLGLSGFRGGKLAGLCTQCIVVPSENMQQIEDLHMILLHLIFSLVRDRVKL